MRKIRFKFCRMTLVLTPCLCAFLLVTSGCFPLPGLEVFNAYTNEKLKLKQNVTDIQTVSRSGSQDYYSSQNYFIGLALSGGGSRAANFGSGVLWELDRLGILQHVQYISTVSGGSLAGAYYATFRDDPLKWNKTNLQQVMSQSFELWSLWYGLNPLHWPQYLGTSYNRSHLLEEVFSRRVFEKRTFGDLRHGQPTLLLNATDYSTGERFVFSNYSFDNMRSDLSALPISVGVTASSAFPGILPVVTFKDFRAQKDMRWGDNFKPDTKIHFKHWAGYPTDSNYFHLFDGGISDNLGVDTLREIARSGPRCLLILVDAYVPYEHFRASTELSPRQFRDVLIDTNALNAASILMESKRHEQLKAIGFDDIHRSQSLFKWSANDSELEQLEDVWKKTKDPKDLRVLNEAVQERVAAEKYPAKHFRSPNEIEVPASFLEEAFLGRSWRSYNTGPPMVRNCKVWHIALNDLIFTGFSPELYRKDYETRYEKSLNEKFDVFQRKLGLLETRFSISDSDLYAVYAAAELLVNETKSKNTICRWIKDITGQTCTVP